MSFLKKLFSNPKPTTNEEVNKLDHLALDELFVHNFIKKGGKFLYCVNQEEVTTNLVNILKENDWEKAVCFDDKLTNFLEAVKIHVRTVFQIDSPFFTTCEHLIAENGSILFSSNQIKENKISTLPENFIVYATTSQIVKNKGDSLTGIKSRYKNLPTNISAIKSYNPDLEDDNFLNYGNNNAKNLYLLLFEDL